MLLSILNGERTEGFYITTILRFKITSTLIQIIHYGDFNSTNPAFLIILWCLFVARLQKNQADFWKRSDIKDGPDSSPVNRSCFFPSFSSHLTGNKENFPPLSFTDFPEAKRSLHQFLKIVAWYCCWNCFTFRSNLEKSFKMQAELRKFNERTLKWILHIEIRH